MLPRLAAIFENAPLIFDDESSPLVATFPSVFAAFLSTADRTNRSDLSAIGSSLQVFDQATDVNDGELVELPGSDSVDGGELSEVAGSEPAEASGSSSPGSSINS